MLRIKRVHSEALRDEVYALRYRAYRREDAIDPNPTERFEDKYDSQPNHILWALTEHERVVGSIRTTWYQPGEPWAIPEMDGYREDVARLVPPEANVFSGNRFVTDPDSASRSGLLAMLLLRYHLSAVGDADIALAAVRTNHLPFYRRILRLEKASEGRPYPGLNSIMYLTACQYRHHIDDVYKRTPQLRQKGYERMLRDDRYRDVWEVGLPIEDQMAA